MRSISLIADKREEIIGKEVVADIRVPFWTRLKLLFCPWLRVTVPLKLAFPSAFDYAKELTVFRVEHRQPIKLVAEVAIPFDARAYMDEHDIRRFATEELLKQFNKQTEGLVKLEQYSDPVRCATIVRGVIGVVDLRNG